MERIRETRSQVGLTAGERASNMTDAFEWSGGDVSVRVLLIDDVCTTGSTLSECAYALRKRGAEHIFAATVARAVGDAISADV